MYPGYPPPGYGYPPPGYGHLPPGYPVPVGFPGPAPWQPGVIPLRPLSLTDIFNGAVGYVRANPKPTLGLTTVIVLITTVMGFLLGLVTSSNNGDVQVAAGVITGILATLLATTLLAGMLTVIVARSVLGLSITVGQAWRQVRGRLPALIGLTLLAAALATALVAAVVLTIVGLTRTAGGTTATLVGIPLVLVLLAVLAAAATLMALAPVAVVLERKNIFDAIRRSVALSRRRFWRIFGILFLASLVTAFISGAISVPFDIASNVVALGTQPEEPTVAGSAIASVGRAIGQIITTPFIAGVVALLYVDARIRSEAFDFTLLSAAGGHADPDSLWLGR